MNHLHTNELIHQSSPYLLQHAHNPVNWVAWGEAAFERAKAEDKLVLISIGYSACHWCHVMEHESFEDEEVAEIMNRHFICIKIDREEHPHIDSLYMSAVQLMSKQGGWPLNCFVLPDQRPIYGGTYFPKSAWMQILQSLEQVYRNDRKKVFDYAERITQFIQHSELIDAPEEVSPFDLNLIQEAVRKWQDSFDPEHGGMNRAPRFPMPSNYQLLLHYAWQTGNKAILDHTHLTLQKMAMGGIFDQLGGGFARYSVDDVWKVPHFEKMLYDNAQLITLYAEAFTQSGNEYYRKTAEHCIEFIDRELTSPDGVFYAALDADSEGVEGLYYTWTKNEIRELLTDDEFTAVETHFNLNKNGFWEHDRYILLKTQDLVKSATQLGIEPTQLHTALETATKKLLAQREKRIKPGLDNKIITSWNAQMIKALADSSCYFSAPHFLDRAIKAMRFMENNVQDNEGNFFHIYNRGETKVANLLEDPVFVIEAYLALYRASLDESWLNKAFTLSEKVIQQFSDEDGVFFYFTSNQSEKLISRKKEISDNVIPAANSVMAMNLFLLGKYFYRDEWVKRAERMLTGVIPSMQEYLPGYSNWARLLLYCSETFHELALSGDDALTWANQLTKTYLPNTLVAAANQESELPMLKGKYVFGQTLAYVCHDKRCDKPLNNFDEILSAIAI